MGFWSPWGSVHYDTKIWQYTLYSFSSERYSEQICFYVLNSVFGGGGGRGGGEGRNVN